MMESRKLQVVQLRRWQRWDDPVPYLLTPLQFVGQSDLTDFVIVKECVHFSSPSRSETCLNICALPGLYKGTSTCQCRGSVRAWLHLTHTNQSNCSLRVKSTRVFTCVQCCCSMPFDWPGVKFWLTQQKTIRRLSKKDLKDVVGLCTDPGIGSCCHLLSILEKI